MGSTFVLLIAKDFYQHLSWDKKFYLSHLRNGTFSRINCVLFIANSFGKVLMSEWNS